MASISHPLIGDELYGQKSNEISHTALACSEMTFIHPITNNTINLKVNIPQDMITLIGNKI